MRAKYSLNTFFSLTLCVGSLALTGCDEEEGGDTAGDTGGAEGSSDGAETGGSDTGGGAEDDGGEAAQIEVTVNYDGAQTGNLTIAAFSMWPPAGPPSAFEGPTAMPTFPATAGLSGLAAGDYTVVAILDIGGDNPTTPGEEDLQATSEITIEDGGDPIVVDLTLMDQ